MSGGKEQSSHCHCHFVHDADARIRHAQAITVLRCRQRLAQAHPSRRCPAQPCPACLPLPAKPTLSPADVDVYIARLCLFWALLNTKHQTPSALRPQPACLHVCPPASCAPPLRGDATVSISTRLLVCAVARRRGQPLVSITGPADRLSRALVSGSRTRRASVRIVLDIGLSCLRWLALILMGRVERGSCVDAARFPGERGRASKSLTSQRE